MNGNSELAQTENVIFYVSYGVLTEFLRMNVILTYFATATATVTETDTERWKSGINTVKLRVCVTGRVGAESSRISRHSSQSRRSL